MSNAIYLASTQTFNAALGSLSEILTKAAAHENAASLPAARLAPDMFPLSTQVQIACFHASSGTARLMGHDVPARPSIQELDLAGLQDHITQAQAKLSAQAAADFAGAEERRITMPLQPPMVMEIDGQNFLNSWLLPNFYFHFVTAYDILRHAGLPLGKKDFLFNLAPFMRMGS